MQKCKICGKWYKNKRGITVHTRMAHKTNITFSVNADNQNNNTGILISEPNEEIIDVKNKVNQLSLKYTILERKIDKVITNGINVQQQSKENIEAIERIKEIQKETLKTPEQKNFIIVIQELIFKFKTGDSLLRHERYSDDEIRILSEEELNKRNGKM